MGLQRHAIIAPILIFALTAGCGSGELGGGMHDSDAAAGGGDLVAPGDVAGTQQSDGGAPAPLDGTLSAADAGGGEDAAPATDGAPPAPDSSPAGADSGADSTPPSASNLAFEEQNGRVVVEAEHFFENDANGKPRQWYVWKPGAAGVKPDPDPEHTAGASGGSYIEGLPDTRVTASDTLTSGVNFFGNGGQGPIVRYRVWFNQTGRYYVRARAYSTGAEDNGIHVGIDGTWPASGERIQWCSGKNQWTWSGAQRTAANHCGEADKIYLDVTSKGLHVIAFSMREDGFELDRFVLTIDKAFNPSGAGPAESATRKP
ncbi:MAG: hypothetical protein KC503_12140 [Myxococcales bacterium]|nr:hypothetical protein [Myxococcales bacterium]